MPHDFPVAPKFLKDAVQPARTKRVEQLLRAISPEHLHAFVKKACEKDFEPNLSKEAFDMLIARAKPETIELIRERLKKRIRPDGSTYVSEEGLARLEAFVRKDPDRK